MTSVLTFFTCRIMSDEHNNLNYEFDDKRYSILSQSEDKEEPMEQEEAE